METKIDATVENVVYSNRETGFTVLEVSNGGETTTVVGVLGGVSVGERLLLYGEYVNHPSFGPQFKAQAAERILPSGQAAIERYLGGGAIPGLGPVLAGRIVRAFGDETFEIIEHQPERLEGIKGISPQKARAISSEFLKIHSLRSVINQLTQMGLQLPEVLSLYRAFGPSAAELLEDNPYMLCGYPTYMDFEAADAIASSLGGRSEDPNRLKACLIYVLQHNSLNGHTCIPTETLVATAANFLGTDRESMSGQLYEAADFGMLKLSQSDWGEAASLPALAEAESYIAERLLLLRERNFTPVLDIQREIAAVEQKNGILYSGLQREAIAAALTSGAVVITGGPGTGKTTALNAIIQLLERMGEKVMLCAPTGRAAKRLSQLTGRDASTVHRLLEVEYRDGPEPPGFVHKEQNPLKCDAVVVDEMSMVDVNLFRSLLAGIRPDCRLVMVGDSDQLPAVGPGNLLRDIVSSGALPAVELKEVFRQASASRIITAAHEIVSGRVPDLSANQEDFFFLRVPRSKAAGFIGDLVERRLPAAYGFDPSADIQVLAPGRKGQIGTIALNGELRDRLNPPAPGRAQLNVMGRLFREGDKVMQIKNNYDLECRRGDEVTLGVFNGDIGTLQHIDRKAGIITCAFDDKLVDYTPEQAAELELAYAITVHKSQGSEYPAVVLCLSDVNRKLMYRNLLYTAVTRAKNLLVVVGEERTVQLMVANDRKTLRYTCLERLLR